jgi:hypothetical protein
MAPRKTATYPRAEPWKTVTLNPLAHRVRRYEEQAIRRYEEQGNISPSPPPSYWREEGWRARRGEDRGGRLGVRKQPQLRRSGGG